MPNFDREYRNEFLEDEEFHPKKLTSSSTGSPGQVKKAGSRGNL
jgi:hypothetical protein